MGNRAVITFTNGSDKTYPKNGIGYYLHWNGGRASVEAFLQATRAVMGDRLGDETYGKARLAQFIGTFIGGNLSFGIGTLDELDCDNGDNGLYIIDPKTMRITGREYFTSNEQNSYDVKEMADFIVRKIKAAETVTE